MADRIRAASVELVAMIQGRDGTTPVTILVDGASPVCGLASVAMLAVAAQHPHLGGKPIVALRYNIGVRP